jgi:hypothetical protein
VPCERVAQRAIGYGRGGEFCDTQTADEADLGGRYTLKRWRVAKRTQEEGVTEVDLRPDNRSYRTLTMRASDGEVRVVGEFLELLE